MDVLLGLETVTMMEPAKPTLTLTRRTVEHAKTLVVLETPASLECVLISFAILIRIVVAFASTFTMITTIVELVITIVEKTPSAMKLNAIVRVVSETAMTFEQMDARFNSVQQTT